MGISLNKIGISLLMENPYHFYYYFYSTVPPNMAPIAAVTTALSTLHQLIRFISLTGFRFGFHLRYPLLAGNKMLLF